MPYIPRTCLFYNWKVVPFHQILVIINISVPGYSGAFLKF